MEGRGLFARSAWATLITMLMPAQAWAVGAPAQPVQFKKLLYTGQMKWKQSSGTAKSSAAGMDFELGSNAATTAGRSGIVAVIRNKTGVQAVCERVLHPAAALAVDEFAMNCKGPMFGTGVAAAKFQFADTLAHPVFWVQGVGAAEVL